MITNITSESVAVVFAEAAEQFLWDSPDGDRCSLMLMTHLGGRSTISVFNMTWGAEELTTKLTIMVKKQQEAVLRAKKGET